MNFTIDKEKKLIHIERSFNAPLQLVWDAWTKPEILDQWWAPKPWKTNTVSMDFKLGGSWIYNMDGPDEETYRCEMKFDKIEDRIMYSGLDNWNKSDLPGTHWTVRFNSIGENTLVIVEAAYSELESLETVVEMGFTENFAMVLENLDGVLEGLRKVEKG